MTNETRETARPVHVTRAEEIDKQDTGQTQGMIRQSAIVKLSPSICGTLMRAKPHSSSAIHHHGDQDTIIYAVSGHGTVVSRDTKTGEEQKQHLNPGDWGLIPAFREHQEVNEGDEEVVWVIVRAPGGTPIVRNLEGWGGKEVD